MSKVAVRLACASSWRLIGAPGDVCGESCRNAAIAAATVATATTCATLPVLVWQHEKLPP